MQNYWFNKATVWMGSFILQKETPIFERKKLLIDTRRFLESREPKFYDPASNCLTVEFAELLFDMYRYSGLLKKSFSLDDWESSDKLTEMFVFTKLKTKDKELLNQFKPYHLLQVLNNSGVVGLNDFISSKMTEFERSVTRLEMHDINESFSRFFELMRLVEFDFEYILSYLMKPRTQAKHSKADSLDFKNTSITPLIDKLELLTHIVYSIDLYGDFHLPVHFLGRLNGNRTMPNYELSQLIECLMALRSNNYLAVITGYVKGNPYFRPIQDYKTLPIFEKFLAKLQSKVKQDKEAILKHVNQNSNGVLSAGNHTQSLKYYNTYYKTQAHALQVDGFHHIYALNCLNYFLMGKYKSSFQKMFIWMSNKLAREDLKPVVFELCYFPDRILKQIRNLDYSLKESKANTCSILNMLEQNYSKKLQGLLAQAVGSVDTQAEVIMFESKKFFEKVQFFLRSCMHDAETQKVLFIKDSITGAEYQSVVTQWAQQYNDMAQFLVLLEPVFQDEKYLKLA